MRTSFSAEQFKVGNVRDANSFNNLQALRFSRGTLIRSRLHRWRENSGPVGILKMMNPKGDK